MAACDKCAKQESKYIYKGGDGGVIWENDTVIVLVTQCISMYFISQC